MSVIPTTEEAETREGQVQGQFGQLSGILSRNISEKKKKAGALA